LRFLKNILSNPLFHFLILALLIYVIYGFFGDKQNTDSERTIVVTPSTINWLEKSWEKRWIRLPTEKEMDGLIDQYVREKILSREALNMGLDKDDIIIRRRLAQKFEFLTKDLIQAPEPSEKELNNYFNDNKSKYKKPDLTTFTHIFFDPDKREEKTLKDAEQSKIKLNKLEQPTEGIDQFGDTFMLQSYYPERTEQEILKLFGPEFAKAVSEEIPTFSVRNLQRLYLKKYLQGSGMGLYFPDTERTWYT
jgi:DNA-directed RNA polymerase